MTGEARKRQGSAISSGFRCVFRHIGFKCAARASGHNNVDLAMHIAPYIRKEPRIKKAMML